MKETVARIGTGCCSRQPKELDASVPQGQVAGLYDAISPFYDIWGHLTESQARKRAIQLADIRDGEHILEVAVGTGLAFCEILRQNPTGKNVGIDLSEGMLRQARKRIRKIRNPQYELKIGNAFHLDEEDAAFDLLMNNYMFDLLPFDEMGLVLKEFWRVLKPGGRLVLVNMTAGEKLGSGIYERLYRISPRLMGGCRGVRLTEKLKAQGFRVIRREYYQQILFPSEVILSQRPLG